MKNLVTIFILVLLVSTSFVNGKGKYGVIGKVYTSERAMELYGPVIKSIEMDKSDLIAMLDQCEDYMMFKVKNDEVVITDDNRNVLTSNKIFLTTSIVNYISKNDVITDEEPLNMFSKSKVIEIINKGNSDIVYFEKRGKVETIRTNKYVLEFAGIIGW